MNRALFANTQPLAVILFTIILTKMNFMKINKTIIFIILLFLTSCKKNEIKETRTNTDSSAISLNPTDNSISEDLENESVNEEDSTNSSIYKYGFYINTDFTKTFSRDLCVTDKEGKILKYDDEMDFSQIPNMKEFFYAKRVINFLDSYYNKKYGKETMRHEKTNGGQNFYTRDYIEFLNSKINLVNELPLKSDDEMLNEIFNKIYYDYQEYEIFAGEKKYGVFNLYLSKDGQPEYGKIFGEVVMKNPKISLARDKVNGNLIIR